MNDDLLFKNTCKVLLSLLFILLISRIDKSPLDTPSAIRAAHTSEVVSFLGKSSQTFETSLFLIRLCFDQFTIPTVKHHTTFSSFHNILGGTETDAIIFYKYRYRNRSNQVLTKVLLIWFINIRHFGHRYSFVRYCRLLWLRQMYCMAIIVG